ncbi:MAG: hypothetical protein EA356_17600 [Geminicoccaceae bacterium]|nr:MAG: hypothetical protein EA356_17600 [Geminicoccaceae bacterium]
MIALFLLGSLAGLLLAAPFGPVGALALRQTLHWGFRGGMACGVGTAVADAIIGGFVGLGVGMLKAWFDDHVRELEIGAGLVLIAVGVAAVLEIGAKAKPKLKPGIVPIASQGRLLASTTQAFLVTIGNPAIAGAFAAMFTALGIHNRIEQALWAEALVALTAGIFLGAILCWAAFVWVVGHVSGRVADIWLHRVHRGVGVLLILLGIGVVGHAVL